MREGGARLTLSCGGHPLPIVIRSSGETQFVGRYGSLLGILPDPTLFDVAVDLHGGDVLVFYTDGILDERQAAGTSGEERLMTVLSSNAGLSAAQVAGSLERYLKENRAELPRDDAAFLVLRVIP
jgi:serine phosphatase RsbU (regulator of sigma subunit)